jgi:hypothetical protein
MATIRVAEVASRANGGVPSGSWLAFWNIIEAGIGKKVLWFWWHAFILQSLPALTVVKF